MTCSEELENGKVIYVIGAVSWFCVNFYACAKLNDVMRKPTQPVLATSTALMTSMAN